MIEASLISFPSAQEINSKLHHQELKKLQPTLIPLTEFQAQWRPIKPDDPEQELLTNHAHLASLLQARPDIAIFSHVSETGFLLDVPSWNGDTTIGMKLVASFLNIVVHNSFLVEKVLLYSQETGMVLDLSSLVPGIQLGSEPLFNVFLEVEEILDFVRSFKE